MGVMLILNEEGDVVVADIAAVPPRKGNYADREYFQVHRASAGLGLHVGGVPIVSRLDGERMLPFSRRIDKPDGSFGGVVLGTVKLSYFTHLFSEIDLGPGGAINLYLTDGTRIMRYPYVEADLGANIAQAPTFRRFLREGRGSFVSTSVRDGVERSYTFTRIGTLPLILNVALSTKDVEADWAAKATIIGGIVLALCGLTIALSLLFGRELRRREAMRAEMAALSRTDALTGLPNRRCFEDITSGLWTRPRRDGHPLSLLIVDADHFKRFNDQYGHPWAMRSCRAWRAVCRRASPPAGSRQPHRRRGVRRAPARNRRGGRPALADTIHAEVTKLPVPSAGSGQRRDGEHRARRRTASGDRSAPPCRTCTAWRTAPSTRPRPAAAIRRAARRRHPRRSKGARCSW